MTPAADAAVCQCGHPQIAHDFTFDKYSVCSRCHCGAFVADVNRPDDPCSISGCDSGVVAVRSGRALCKHHDAEQDHAAVPDREGATEQLAALLAAHHRYIGDCACGWRPDYSAPDPQPQHRAHVAAVIVAAGWRKA